LSIDEKIPGDPKEPNGFLAHSLTPKLARAATGSVKHLLHEILSILGTPRMPEAVPVQRAVIALEQVGQEVLSHNV
jgi:hypothetical protein